MGRLLWSSLVEQILRSREHYALNSFDKKLTFRDIFLNSISSDMNTNTMMPEVLPGGLLVLPQSFGNIYLGETFSSYVCVHNDSTEVGRSGVLTEYNDTPPQVCTSVVVRADLQTATQRINLVPGNSTDLASHSRDSLAPGSTIDQVQQGILSGVK